MDEWHSLIQTIIEEVDGHIRKRDDETLTLSALSQRLGFNRLLHICGADRAIVDIFLREINR